jgi:hypothetical protein
MISEMAKLFNVPEFLKKSDMDVSLKFMPHLRGAYSGEGSVRIMPVFISQGKPKNVNEASK